MTLEEKAENYIIDKYKLNECYLEDNKETREYMRIDVHSQYEEEYQLYLAGLHEGQPKWHDLRKDPKDIPPIGETVLLYFGTDLLGKMIVETGKIDSISNWYSRGLTDSPLSWSEIKCEVEE